MHKGKNGFTAVEALVILLVLVVLVGVGYKVINSNKQQSQNSTTNTQPSPPTANNKEVVWRYNEKTLEYFAQSGTPPKCKEPFVFSNSPIDVANVTAVLMPGQYRGFNYKPHGGFGTADNLNTASRSIRSQTWKT